MYCCGILRDDRVGFEAVLLEIDLVAAGQQRDRRPADLGHVPGVALRVDHALDLRDRLGIRLHADDFDAGRLRERPVEDRAVGLGVDAAIVAHDDAFALRARRAPDRRHREEAADVPDQKPAADGFVLPQSLMSPPFASQVDIVRLLSTSIRYTIIEPVNGTRS